MSSSKSKFTASQAVGLGLLMVGIFLIVVNYTMIQSQGLVFQRLLIVGISCIPLGISMLIFRGGNIGATDLSNGQGLQQIINAAPKGHLFAWGLSFLVGLIGGFYLYTTYVGPL